MQRKKIFQGPFSTLAATFKQKRLGSTYLTAIDTTPALLKCVSTPFKNKNDGVLLRKEVFVCVFLSVLNSRLKSTKKEAPKSTSIRVRAISEFGVDGEGLGNQFGCVKFPGLRSFAIYPKVVRPLRVIPWKAIGMIYRRR